MKALFVGFLNVSLSGSVIIILVLLLRLLLKKAPRALICALWALAILRLLLPFQVETSFSMRPDVPIFTVRDTELTMDVTPVPEAQIPDYIPHTSLGNTKTAAVDYMAIGAYAWVGIAAIMVAYTLVSYIRLKWRLRGAVCLEKGVYIAQGLNSAILLGYFKPRIYLSDALELAETELVIAHERMHQKRGDNWLKLFGFLCLCLHWFNPLVWIAYVVLCKDIEDACDEQVISKLDIEDRKLYSSALLSCGKDKKLYIGCPVAFGEISIRQRILNVLNYRKPTLWISIAAVVAVFLVAIFFMTDPVQGKPPYYDKMVSSLGERLETVCEELDIPEVSGETPITVEFLGIQFKLHIYADEFRTDNEVYSFAYVAEYKNDPETAARDIVTLSRYHWRQLGEGLGADGKRYPNILSYITEEDIIETIEKSIRRKSSIEIINDGWDITEKSGYQFKKYIEELKQEELYSSAQEDGDDLLYREPYAYYSIEAYSSAQNEEDQIVRVVLNYRVHSYHNRIPKIVVTYIEEQTWWDKLLYWLK